MKAQDADTINGFAGGSILFKLARTIAVHS